MNEVIYELSEKIPHYFCGVKKVVEADNRYLATPMARRAFCIDEIYAIWRNSYIMNNVWIDNHQHPLLKKLSDFEKKSKDKEHGMIELIRDNYEEAVEIFEEYNGLSINEEYESLSISYIPLYTNRRIDAFKECGVEITHSDFIKTYNYFHIRSELWNDEIRISDDIISSVVSVKFKDGNKKEFFIIISSRTGTISIRQTPNSNDEFITNDDDNICNWRLERAINRILDICGDKR